MIADGENSSSKYCSRTVVVVSEVVVTVETSIHNGSPAKIGIALSKILK
jgi:hypothetical protein